MKKFFLVVSLVLGFSQGAYAWHCACKTVNETAVGLCIAGSQSGYTNTNTGCDDKKQRKCDSQGRNCYWDYTVASAWCQSDVCVPTCGDGKEYSLTQKKCVSKCTEGFNWNPTSKKCDASYSCVGDDCGLKGAASFNFNIEMGGAQANLYVCEVGFLKHLCDTKDCGSRYLKVKTDKILGSGQTQYKTFTKADAVTSADLFLNDLNFGASFYVKYCFDAKRKLVGDAFNYPTWTLDSKVVLTPGLSNGGLSDYFNVAELKAEVYKDCNSSTTPKTLVVGAIQGTLVESFDHFEDLTATTVKLHDNKVLTPVSGCIGENCVFTVVYREMNKCIRPLKCVGNNCGDAYKGTINTLVNFDLFDCAGGRCL